jgi:cell division protein FtsI (penicillin-binding protein 3)
MTDWRRSKRQSSALQPSLPGLFTPAKSRRLATPHEQALDLAHSRLVAAIFIFSLAFLIISGRLTFLTLISEAPELSMAHHQTSDSLTARADMTDRNGTVLATSLPTISLCADARKMIDPDKAAKQLISVLPDLDAARLDEAIHSAKHCVMIKRHLTPQQTYDVNRLGIAGLEFEPDERRMYPAGNVAAHVVGYTDIDNNGLSGMEQQLDEKLEQQPQPVALSIDLRAQSIMHRELSNAIDEFHAEGGAGMIMDVTTGEIIAMVSLPDFDPQHPGGATDDSRFNRDTLGVYEMGSTFKIFNTALALDSGLVHLGDSFDTTHNIEVGSQSIHDFHNENRWLNVAEIFTHSSNIGSARMAERFGGVRQRTFLSRLGLTEKLPLELPEVGKPLVPAARDWGTATTMTVAFGHGIAVNVAQLLGAVATVIGDGKTVHPTLLKHVASAEDATRETVVSPHTSAVMRGLMRLVVTRGTAKAAEVAGYLVGGKTGTADKLSANHHYNANARLSSFIGVFPLNAPRYIVFAMLDDPKGNSQTYGFATGGWVAAPAVSRVISQVGPLLGVQPMSPDIEAAAERQLLKPLGSQIVDGMPVEEGSNYASVESDSVQ